MYLRYTLDISPLFLPCRPGGSAALPPARDNRVGLYREVWLPVHVLPGLYKDARTGRRVTEFFNVLLGDVADASFRGRQEDTGCRAGRPVHSQAMRLRHIAQPEGKPS